MTKQRITTGQRAALALLATYTGGTFDAWQMAGDRHVIQRQQIMNQLAGRKVPSRDCTVVSMLDAIYAIAPPFEGQPTQREAALAAWAVEQITTTGGDTRGARPERLGYAERSSLRTLTTRRA